MNWRRTIEHLAIDESAIHDGIAVARLSNYRYVVLMDGTVYSFGGSSHPARGMLVSQVLACVTGESVPAPCVECDQPREHLSYCREHYNERHAEWARIKRNERHA